MLKKSKWVKAESAQAPVSEVARRAVQERLELVWQYLPLAAAQWEDNVEYVHQLRVATRRAGAVLTLFDELLPSKRTRKMKKRLGRVRNAAGDARDLDVLLLRLQDEMVAGRGQALSGTLHTLARMRKAAQKPIRKACRKLRRRHFPKEIVALAKRTRWRGDGEEPVYQQVARSLLAGVVDEFFTAAAGNLDGADKLHALRIRGKQLRYTMEILAGAFGSWFRQELYPQVEEIQEMLGTLNDHATAQRNFQHWRDTTDDPLAARQFSALADAEGQQLAQSQEQFLQWWTPQRCARLQSQFAEVL